jgi:type IV secretion system protein VirD4
MSHYRLPRKPGYLGGVNWHALGFGLLLFVLAQALATQYIAAKFQYQLALGRPIFSTSTARIYQPFSWMGWGFHNLMSQDPRIKTPLAMGEMIAVAGSFLALGLFFFATSRRSRRLSRNTEDLHGSARLADENDIRETGLMDAKQGIYVGGWERREWRRVWGWLPWRFKHLYYLRHDGPEHVLAFAPTRAGKGVGLVIPTLLGWSESAVIYDIKGENWAKTAGFRARQGHLCFKFSPVEEGAGSRFNPLCEVRLFTPRDVADAQNIANMIVRTGEDSPQERFWQDSAASLTTGMILHVCYEAARNGRTANLADLAHVFTRPGADFRERIESELLNFEHDPGHLHDWHMPTGERTVTHPVVREKVQQMLDKEDREFGSVLSTCSTALSLYSDPLVARNTSVSDFRINDLVNYELPISLYLVVPPADKIRLRPLMRLMFTMVVNRLTEKMVFERSEQQHNKHRLLLLIDEFPSLNRMEIFADALSYMAGYGIKAYLITQDIRQIVDAYGNNESIVSNCHVRIAFAPNHFETAELLSKMTGTTTVQKATYNFSGSRFAAVMNHINASVDNVERPLMTPDEIMRLRPPKKKGSGDQERIVAPGQMLIFVSGHYPILGTQMLYFFDPILNERAKIPPPSTSEPVGPVDRIAPAEPEATGEMGAGEEAFLEELGV